MGILKSIYAYFTDPDWGAECRDGQPARSGRTEPTDYVRLEDLPSGQPVRLDQEHWSGLTAALEVYCDSVDKGYIFRFHEPLRSYIREGMRRIGEHGEVAATNGVAPARSSRGCDPESPGKFSIDLVLTNMKGVDGDFLAPMTEEDRRLLGESRCSSPEYPGLIPFDAANLTRLVEQGTTRRLPITIRTDLPTWEIAVPPSA